MDAGRIHATLKKTHTHISYLLDVAAHRGKLECQPHLYGSRSPYVVGHVMLQKVPGILGT